MPTEQEKQELMSSLAEGCRQYGDYLMECREIWEAHNEGHICDATALRMFKNAYYNQLTEDEE